MKILAVDPGGTTGIAAYDTDAEAFFSTQAEGYEDAADAITASAADADVLVCEGFVIRSNTHKLDSGAFALTTDLVGACRLTAYINGIEFVRQTPAQAKSFASDDKLKRLGWYHPTPGGHRNDAARHLLAYFARIQYAPILTLLTD